MQSNDHNNKSKTNVLKQKQKLYVNKTAFGLCLKTDMFIWYLSFSDTYMWNLKTNINEKTKQKQIHRYRKQTDGCQRDGGF